MRTRSIVTSLAAVLASASFLVSETQATTFTGTAYYTDFASPRVNKVDYFYDNVTHTFTMSAPTLVTTLNGADGIVFAPNSSLLVGGQGTGFMQEVFRVPHGDRCATNQVLYNIGERAIERDLLPWCKRHGIPVMAYTPLGGSTLLRDPTLAEIGGAHGCSTSAVALAWTIRSGNVIAIPRSGSAAHVKENAVALSLTLTPQEFQTLDRAHPLARR